MRSEENVKRKKGEEIKIYIPLLPCLRPTISNAYLQLLKNSTYQRNVHALSKRPCQLPSTCGISEIVLAGNARIIANGFVHDRARREDPRRREL